MRGQIYFDHHSCSPINFDRDIYISQFMVCIYSALLPSLFSRTNYLIKYRSLHSSANHECIGPCKRKHQQILDKNVGHALPSPSNILFSCAKKMYAVSYPGLLVLLSWVTSIFLTTGSTQSPGSASTRQNTNVLVRGLEATGAQGIEVDLCETALLALLTCPVIPTSHASDHNDPSMR